MKNLLKNLALIILVFLMLAGFLSLYQNPSQSKAEQVDISTVVKKINQSEVSEIFIKGSELELTLTNGQKLKSEKEEGESLSTLLKNYGVPAEKMQGIKIEIKEESGLTYWVGAVLPFILPFLFIIGFIYLLTRQVQSVNNRALSFGQSDVRDTSKKGEKKEVVTFKEVAGCREAKEELVEVVEFLKNPKKFTEVGAKIPKGVLLIGPPGTGKTLMARAVSGEAGVPFFHVSGSEFVELFVGVGASVTGDTPVLIRENDRVKLMSIKDFTDPYYKESEENFIVPVRNIKTLGFKAQETKFCGVKENSDKQFFGQSYWQEIKGVFRHKAAKIYEIHYLGGLIRTTGDHSIFIRERNMIRAKKAAELKKGDILVNLPFKVRSKFISGIGTTHKVKAHKFSQELPNERLRVWDDEENIDQKYEYVLAMRGKVTQSELAQEIGVAQGTIYHWQTGKNIPDGLSRQLRRTEIPEYVAVTPDLFKLFGYYTAEGRGTNNLEFTFGFKEKELHQDVQELMKKIFGLNATMEVTADNTLKIKYYSAPLGRFFSRWCGNGSHHKHLPGLLWDLPKEYFLKFLEGYFLGDGYTTSDGKLSVSSVSQQLIREISWLSAMHGIKVGVRECYNKPGRIIKNKPLPGGYYWNLMIGKTAHPFIENKSPANQFKKPYIKKIVVKDYNDYVYDLCGCENEAFFGGEKPILLHNSRVRSLFQKAKKNAPCIVFIDELDAIGRQRGAGLGGSHDEREQTLNQILVEMDGFEPNSGVIVLSATNRPDILDVALLRPGRFDRRVTLDLPDINEREEILKTHARGKPLARDVDLKRVAERTPGFSGADLANLMNEAAILTAKRDKKKVQLTEILESIEKVMLGPERKSRVLLEKEKEITAYHEAGHALVAHCLPAADPVQKVSVIARGQAGGYTLKMPEHDRHMYAKSEFLAELAVFLAGHATEKEIFGEVTTGAQSDLRQATKLARRLVTEYGMSDKLGPRTFGGKEELIFLGREISEQRDYSEKVAQLIDNEVSSLIAGAYDTACGIIKKEKVKLKRIVDKLLEKETLEREEFEEIVGKKTMSS